MSSTPHRTGPPEGLSPERLTVIEQVTGPEALLRLRGELDHDTAPGLREALRRSEAAGAARILVDCAELAFCDSTGLNVLLDARARAQARGAGVELVGLSRGVSRVFEVTGAGALFPQWRSLADARSGGDGQAGG